MDLNSRFGSSATLPVLSYLPPWGDWAALLLIVAVETLHYYSITLEVETTGFCDRIFPWEPFGFEVAGLELLGCWSLCSEELRPMGDLGIAGFFKVPP